MDVLLDSLGFLGPITTSLPLITFRAYWPLSHPNEFTNSFPGLPRSIYFLFIFLIPMGLLLHSLGFLGPFTPSLPLFILVSLLAINPAISTCWACFRIPLLFSPSHFLYIVELLLLLGPLSKVGIISGLTGLTIFRVYVGMRVQIC